MMTKKEQREKIVTDYNIYCGNLFVIYLWYKYLPSTLPWLVSTIKDEKKDHTRVT